MQHAEQANFVPFKASDWKLGIVVAQFNHDITDPLLKSALTRANEYDISKENITVHNVAGSIEIPLVLQHMAKSGEFTALLAIGCVIKGETPHFDYVCKFVTDGISRVQLDNDMPVGFGVLTCNTKEEAEARKKLGADHLDAVLHQAKLLN